VGRARQAVAQRGQGRVGAGQGLEGAGRLVAKLLRGDGRHDRRRAPMGTRGEHGGDRWDAVMNGRQGPTQIKEEDLW
jgi:hypothetical protein